MGDQSYHGMQEVAVPVLYLDLDGTVRHGYEELGRFVNSPKDVHVFPEAITMMQAWRDMGGRIAGVTNQGGVAMGHLTFDEMTRAMWETHRQTGNLFDLIMFCTHYPDASDPEMARCWCRKPSAGAIVEAAHGLPGPRIGERYPPHLALMVGDSETDRLCAESASVDFEWAADWHARARAM